MNTPAPPPIPPALVSRWYLLARLCQADPVAPPPAVMGCANLEPLEARECDGPPERAQASERAALVRRALCELPWRERKVLRLRFFEGLLLAEVGARIGVSKEWARQLEARALGRLRLALWALRPGRGG